MSDKYTDLLVFSRPQLIDGLNKMFKDISEKSKQSELVTDPAGSISRYFPEIIGPVNLNTLSEANRLVFSILANDKFFKWVIKYNNRFRKYSSSLELANAIDKTQIRKDIAKAMVEFGDEQLMFALMGQSKSESISPAGLRMSTFAYAETAVAVIAVAVITILITAIDFTPFVHKDWESMGINGISAPEIRSISEQMVAAAKHFVASKL